MDNFDEIIKQQVEEFSAPYNEAHWAEMEGRLDSIRAKKVRRNTLVAAGAIAIISISSYFYFSNNSNTTHITKEKSTTSTTELANVSNNSEQKEAVSTQQNKPQTQSNTQTTSSPQNDVKENNIESTSPVEKNAKTEPTSKENKTNNSTKTTPQKNTLNANFIVFNNSICMDEEVSFETNEALFPVSYHWDFGDGTVSSKQNPTHRYQEDGKYDVTLTIVNRKTGEEVTHSQKNAVTIFPQPSAKFSYSETSLKHDDNKLKYPYTKFYIKGANQNEKYTWDFGNGEKSGTQNSQTIYKKEGEYKVTLTAENSYGCQSKVTKIVDIKNDYTLRSPNSFTPDGDGINDNFIPKALLGWSDIQFKMVVTDKTGKTVYQSSNQHDPWNGKLNNSGNLLSPGIYLWKVVTYDAQGKAHQHVGKVNLLD